MNLTEWEIFDEFTNCQIFGAIVIALVLILFVYHYKVAVHIHVR